MFNKGTEAYFGSIYKVFPLGSGESLYGGQQKKKSPVHKKNPAHTEQLSYSRATALGRYAPALTFGAGL